MHYNEITKIRNRIKDFVEKNGQSPTVSNIYQDILIDYSILHECDIRLNSMDEAGIPQGELAKEMYFSEIEEISEKVNKIVER